MIKFKDLQRSLIGENSLYTNQAEKDDLLKDTQRLLDAFYLNFFGFVAYFSVYELAPLKKYEQSEGKLILQHIGDANHDVSLSIKLLYDQGLIQRTVVDKMTKLLVKIKAKQIKPTDINEQIIRDLLIEMRYETRRGTMPVMNIMTNFAKGNIQLKHVAYQLYEIAKRKEYKGITKELRAIAVYYSGMLKKIEADKVPTTPVAQPAATTPATTTPVATAPAAIAQPTVAPPAVVQHVPIAQPTPVVVTPVAPAPIGKTPQFWNDLWNARGKIEIDRVLKKYGVEVSQITISEYNTSLASAVTVGDVNLDELKKSYANMILHDLSYLRYLNPIFAKWINEAKSFGDIVDEIANIKEKYSYDVVTSALTTSSGLSDSVLSNRVLELFRNYIDTIDSPSSPAVQKLIPLSPVISNLIVRCARVVVGRTQSEFSIVDQFTVEQAVKMHSIFGHYLVSVYSLGKKITGSTTYSSYDPNYITKDEWERLLDQKTRATIEKFDIIKKINIVITNPEDFDAKLSKVIDMNSFTDFVKEVLRPAALRNPNKKLDYDQTRKILTQVYAHIGRYDQRSWTFETLKMYITVPPATTGGTSWAEEYWSIVFFNGVKELKNKVISLVEMSNLIKDITYYGTMPRNANEYLVDIQPIMLELMEKRVAANDRANDIAYLIQAMPKTFMNELIKRTIQHSDKYYAAFYNFSEGTQIITKDVAEMWFKTGFEMRSWDLSKFGFITKYLQNKEEFGQWLSEYIIANPLPDTFNKSSLYRWMTQTFRDFEPTDEQLDTFASINIISGSFYQYKHNAKVMDYFGRKFLKEVTKESSPFDIPEIIKRMASNSDTMLKSIITDEATDGQISGLLNNAMRLLNAGEKSTFNRKNWTYVNKETYSFDLKAATLMFEAMGSRVFSVDGGEKAVERLAEILLTPSRIEKQYRESVITDVATLFTNADVNADTELAFSKFEKKTQKLLAANFAVAQFAGGAVDEINKNAIIKPRSPLPSKGALKVLKLNQVTIPSSSVIDFRKLRGKNITLAEVKDAALSAAKSFHLQKQAIEQVDISKDELEKLSVAYNRYNRYKHGGIAVKINKVFNVSISSQQLGWKDFIEQNDATNKTTYYYKSPQFHGTASLPASMILRYGFSVIDEKLAREAGIKYAGRMLGDGIYSSNVIDKVSQYINDDSPTGFSRRRGVVGYIFEMESQGLNWGRSCDSPAADFATGGTGEFPQERGGLVSPEWAWKYANKQCKIKRCFEIELIDRDEMTALMRKHRDVMEAMGFSSFKGYLLTEAKTNRVNTTTKYASFTFMDNIIPVGGNRYVDLNEEPETALKLPIGAIVDHGMYGTTIMFKHSVDVSVRFLYGSDINTNYEARSLYEKLLRKRV